MKKLLAAATLAVATGCTMCPDPYDYSGPVPNGSAPQNDFRARSNGILPIGMLPKPWPQIVDREPGQPGHLTKADGLEHDALRVPDLVAQALADDMGPEDDASIEVARVSAEEGEDTAEREAAAETDPVVVPEVELEPIEPEAGDTFEQEGPATDVVEPEAESPTDILPPPAPPSTIPVGPVPRETPGWRPRSQP